MNQPWQQRAQRRQEFRQWMRTDLRVIVLVLVGVLIGKLTYPLVFAGPKSTDRPEARYGLPTEDVVYRDGFAQSTSGHSTRWTIACLTADSLAGNADRSGLHFYQDAEQGPEWRWKDSDYDDSGDDRGHEFPAESAGGNVKVLRASFVITNTMPQTPELNRGPWKALENHVRSLAQQPGAKVYDVVLPLFLPDEKGVVSYRRLAGRIDVPTHCGRAVLVVLPGGKFAAKAWILPNNDAPPKFDECEVSVDALEAAAALDLFSGVDEPLQSELEAGK